MILENKRTIFFSVADVSADAHTARLIRRLKIEAQDLRFVGLGGKAMADEGCQLLENLVERSAQRPDLVVVVDSPAWNFHVAKAARRLDIPVLYYIAPQLWAWGSWRIKKLRKWTNQVACILPFEQQWFTERGIRAVYVGHPLFDDDRQFEALEPTPTDELNFPLVALLPGSRAHEIKHLWPSMQQIADAIRKKYPRARFVSCAPDESKAETMRRNADPDLNIDIRPTSIEAAVRHADLALVASGTSTLQVAVQNCPMIILYYVHPLQWHLVGRWVVKIKYLSLVNILAQKELVPEYMPFYRQEDQVAEKALALLADEKALRQIRLNLQKLVKPITQPGAAAKVAQIVKKMLPRY